MKMGSLAKSGLTESQIDKYLQKVKKEFRHGDASWFLYREMVRERWNYSSEDQIERLYAVLSSWGMNSRGAKLAPFEKLLDSIKKSAMTLNTLAKFRIEEVESFESPTLLGPLKSLFGSLAIVQKVKPKFVGFSKAIHFLLPDLVAPMDRQYTIRFFRGYSTALPKQEELQFDLFVKIMEDYRVFVTDHKLEKYLDDRWNLSLPKICDNIIIGKYLSGK
jgi:hypothetical protein